MPKVQKFRSKTWSQRPRTTEKNKSTSICSVWNAFVMLIRPMWGRERLAVEPRQKRRNYWTTTTLGSLFLAKVWQEGLSERLWEFLKEKVNQSVFWIPLSKKQFRRKPESLFRKRHSNLTQVEYLGRSRGVKLRRSTLLYRSLLLLTWSMKNHFKEIWWFR